jgi:hypothetical protein
MRSVVHLSNCRPWVTGLLKPGDPQNQNFIPQPLYVLFKSFRYDALNRIKIDSTLTEPNDVVSDNQWVDNPPQDAYSETFKYCNNGNIMDVQRNGSKNQQALKMDSLTYHYTWNLDTLIDSLVISPRYIAPKKAIIIIMSTLLTGMPHLIIIFLVYNAWFINSANNPKLINPSSEIVKSPVNSTLLCANSSKENDNTVAVSLSDFHLKMYLLSTVSIDLKYL